MRRIRLAIPQSSAIERDQSADVDRDRTSRPDTTESRLSEEPSPSGWRVESARSARPIVEALIFASPEPITPKMLFKLLADEPKEDVTAAVDGAEGRLREPSRTADGGSRRRLSDRHPARAARVGAPAVPRALVAEADRAGARDAGGDRLQAADHGARDHRDPRREHLAACSRRCSSGT